MNAQDTARPCLGVTFGEPICSYSRAQAFEDGYLVDVTETAREAGFRFPVAMTPAAWKDCVAWADADSTRKHWPQDQAGRLWYVLTMVRFYMRGAVRRAPNAGRCIVRVLRVPREGRGHEACIVSLVAHIGPGDNAEPVITIGFDSDF